MDGPTGACAGWERLLRLYPRGSGRPITQIEAWQASGWEVTEELAHFDGLAGRDMGQPFDILASQ